MRDRVPFKQHSYNTVQTSLCLNTSRANDAPPNNLARVRFEGNKPATSGLSSSICWVVVLV